MASLTLQSISKRFGKAVALSSLDLHVNDGEFCVLLGPSGCGKSTLLNIVAGLIRQDAGTIALDGHAIDRLGPRERDMAMVFQSYALYPHMTVAQNLAFGLRMRGTPKQVIRDRVLEAARLLDIEDLLARKPRQLSGGQQQRVAMGRALTRRPRLFLLDEPLSNLDARMRGHVRLELKQLHRQVSGTFVYVTHDQVEAMTLGEKVVVMDKGKVHQIDPPDRVFDRPADTFVASFIGSPEMNLYEGRILCNSHGCCFQGKGFSLDLGQGHFHLAQQAVTVGMRCNDIEIDPSGQSPLRAKVEMISNVGAEKYVHASLGQEDLTFRAQRDVLPQQDEAVSLRVDLNRVHIFYKGRRIEQVLGTV